MKLFVSILSVFVVLTLTFLFSCGNDVSPSLDLQQKAAQSLSNGNPWGGLGNVEVLASPTGVNPADLAELQLVFNTAGADGDWAPTFIEASGADNFLLTDNSTWYWTGAGTDVITLTNASVTEFTSVEVSDDAFTFTFEVTAPSGGGRTTGIDGYYTLTLTNK
jgi:hypothetical protein